MKRVFEGIRSAYRAMGLVLPWSSAGTSYEETRARLKALLVKEGKTEAEAEAMLVEFEREPALAEAGAAYKTRRAKAKHEGAAKNAAPPTKKARSFADLAREVYGHTGANEGADLIASSPRGGR